MKFGIKTLDDFDLRGKTVLCRVDINQPVDKVTGQLKDTTRIRACVPTVCELAQSGAKVVLLAHQGSDIEYKNYYTTAPHAQVLQELTGLKICFIDDVCGPAARAAIQDLEEGEVLLLDNVRFLAEEQTLFEMKLQLTHAQQAETLLVRKLAPLADLYVCDAFAAAHRDQPSLCGFEQVLPSAMGRLFEQEFSVISELIESPTKPCTFILGGAKISDAFLMMESVLEKGAADHVLTGGLVANILLASQNVAIGQGSLDFILRSNYGEYIERAGAIYSRFSDRIVLPEDVAFVRDGQRTEAPTDAIPQDAAVVDIGAKTIQAYVDLIHASQTVFVNGPMGVFEQAASEAGTRAMWAALGETSAYTVLGGGDSITAAKKYDVMDKIGYVCTGGGALIRFLSGEELPVVRALRHAAETF
jgi:phosphoglycerate kinase